MARKHTDTPPYVPKKGLVEILEQIQMHKQGDLIEGDELHKRGVSRHLIYPALAALRFLGLLDQEDRLLGHHHIFSRENPDREAQKKIIKEAYSDFFESVCLPLESETEARSKFEQVYGLSERLMNSSFPLFQYLAEGAGITICDKGGEPAAETEHGSDRREYQKIETEAGDEETIGKARHGGVQIAVTIQVNKYTNEKDIIRMVKTAKRAVHLLKKSGDAHY